MSEEKPLKKYLLDLHRLFLETHKKGIKQIIWQAFKLGRMCEQEEKRTPAQNNALHLYCQMLADALNNAGLDMKAVLKPDVDIEWTTQSVKDYIWRPIQIKLYGKRSTTKLLKNKGEIDNIHEHINRYLANNPATSGLDYIAFPAENEPKIDYPKEDYSLIPF